MYIYIYYYICILHYNTTNSFIVLTQHKQKSIRTSLFFFASWTQLRLWEMQENMENVSKSILIV